MNRFRQNNIFKIISKSYVTKAFSLYSLSNAMSAVVGFGLLAVYTRYLPPSDFGKISLILIFVTIVTSFIEMRLQTAFAVRFYKVSEDQITKNLYSIFAYYIVIWSIMLTVFLIIPSLARSMLRFNISKLELLILFLQIICTMFGNLSTSIFILSQKPSSYFVIRAIFNVALIVSIVGFLVIMKMGYIAYFEAYLTANFIISGIGLRYFLSHYKIHKHVFSFSSLKELLKIGIPLVPNGLLMMLLSWGDRYILNLYAGLAIVGIYTVGYRFAEVINSFIINPFGQALSPLVFKQFAQTRDKYKDTLSTVFRYYWLVMFGITIAYFVVLKGVFQLLIDPKYMEGYNIVGIVLLGIILWGATNFLGGTVVVAEKTGKMFLFTSISVVLNIGLNFLLIPRYEMYGAAVATLIAYAIQFAMIFTYTQKLVFIDYDYAFIFKSIVFSLGFLALISSLSYVKVNMWLILGLKAILFLLFVLISYKFLELKKPVKRILNYAAVSKQTLG